MTCCCWSSEYKKKRAKDVSFLFFFFSCCCCYYLVPSFIGHTVEFDLSCVVLNTAASQILFGRIPDSEHNIQSPAASDGTARQSRQDEQKNLLKKWNAYHNWILQCRSVCIYAMLERQSLTAGSLINAAASAATCRTWTCTQFQRQQHSGLNKNEEWNNGLLIVGILLFSKQQPPASNREWLYVLLFLYKAILTYIFIDLYNST